MECYLAKVDWAIDTHNNMSESQKQKESMYYMIHLYKIPENAN